MNIAGLAKIPEPLPDISKLEGEFQRYKQKCKDLDLIRQWLQGINIVDRTQIPKVTMDITTSLRSIEEQILQFKKQVKLDDSVITTLSFFLQHDSSLFKAISLKYRQQLKR